MKNVRVFSKSDGKLIRNYLTDVYDFAFSEDGKQVAIIEDRGYNNKGKVNILVIESVDNRDDRKELVQVNGYKFFSGDFVAVNTLKTSEEPHAYSYIYKVFKIGDRSEVKSIDWQMPASYKDWNCWEMSNTGTILAVGLKDRIKIFDLESNKETRTLDGHMDAVTRLAFHPNNSILVSAAEDKTIRFWNLRTGKEIHKIGPLSFVPSRLMISDDGKTLLYFNGSHTIDAEYLGTAVFQKLDFSKLSN